MKKSTVVHPPFSFPEAVLDTNEYSLSIQPPFALSGVTTMMFPLRASLDSLQHFCNNYLNIVPPEVGRFRAPFPFVYLMLLDYGRMAVEVANVGWLAQREILFCVPLEWYKVVNGKWVFHDWASITPFIYVDDDLSMNVGRSVYGWPKTTARMTPTLSNWLQDPLSSINAATVSTSVFAELYAGKRLEEKIFLEVDRQPPMSAMRYPVDAQNSVMPWMIATRLAESITGMVRDIPGLLSGMGIMPMHQGTSGANYMAMMQKMGTTTFPFKPDFTFNTLNLKQFRRSERPDCYAYQALTNGPMRYTALNRAGLLGEERILSGDLTGGFEIKLHQWPSLPIVETLGLEVSHRQRADGTDVAILKPVLPMWYDVNMEYLRGNNLAWRTVDGIWHDADGTRLPPTGEDHDSRLTATLFNTTLGAGNKALAGPFHFSNTTIRVLPLLAHQDKLARFVQTYINEPLENGDCEERLELWGPPNADFAHVYLTATSFGDVTSMTDNIGDWADTEICFLIPVLRSKWSDAAGEWEVCGVGMLPAFTYVDSVTAASSRAEVLGIPTTKATFARPASAWMSEDGAHAEAHQMLLRVDAEVLPAVGEGQKGGRRTILEITATDHEHDHPGLDWRTNADRWGVILKQELARKNATKRANVEKMENACALAMEVLGNRMPMSLYTLKQFRDVTDPSLACYQALVRVHRKLDEVHDIREMERALMVFIHEFPTQPIVALLGLVGKEIDSDGTGITYAIQPQRPFSMSVTMDEDLGQPVVYRSGSLDWKRLTHKAGIDPDDCYLTTPGAIEVGTGSARIQDQGDPRRITKNLLEWEARRPDGNMTPADARAALTTIDPQMIVEALLSREWGSWNEDARWLTYRADLMEGLARAVAGQDQAYHVEVERQFLEAALKRNGSPPGKEVNKRLAAHALDLLAPFGAARALVDANWPKLYKAGEGLKATRGGMSAEQRLMLPLGVTSAVTALRDIKEGVTRIEALEVTGEPITPDGENDYEARTNRRKLRATMRKLQPIFAQVDAMTSALIPADESASAKTQTDAAMDTLMAAADLDRELPDEQQHSALPTLVKDFWNARHDMKRAVRLVEERYTLQLDALLNMLSRTAQKPDFVVRRDSAGPDMDRLFPRGESWDEDWYAGPSRARRNPKPGPAQPVGKYVP